MATQLIHQTTSSSLSKTSSSFRPFLYVWLGYSLVLILSVKLLLFPLGFAERMDFRQLYAGGVLIRNEPANLYDLARQQAVQNELVSKAEGFLPYNHPPFEALLFSVLSRLRFRSAYLAFTCINLALVVSSFFLCPAALCRPGTLGQPRAGLQIFLFFPVTVAILLGQDSLIFLLCLCLTYRQLSDHRYFVGGLLLGALLFKPQFALPIACFLIARHGINVLLGFLAGTSVVFFASVAAVGWNGFVSFGRLLIFTASVNFDGPANALGVLRTSPNLKGLVFLFAPRNTPVVWIKAAIVGVSALIALWVIHKIRAMTLSHEAAFSLAVVSGAVLSFHLHFYDLTPLLLPLGFIAGSQNRLLQTYSWLLFVAPPVLIYIGPSALALIGLILLLLMYEIAENRGLLTTGTPWTAN